MRRYWILGEINDGLHVGKSDLFSPNVTGSLGPFCSKGEANFGTISVGGVRARWGGAMLLEIDGREIDTSELPSLRQLGITAGTWEAAEATAGLSDVPGLERHA